MKKVKWFFWIIAAFSLSACAPAYYEATYHDHYEPSGHVSVVASNNYVVRDYRPVVDHHYGSIEVTLFADRAYLSANFRPIHLVIHDGDFVEVPIRNKRGVLNRIYAHYYRGDLHFDTGRHCNGIHGSSRFKYDKRWDKGHRYDHISAGPDYDLSGYGLIVRKHVSKKVKHSAKRDVRHERLNNNYDSKPQEMGYKSKSHKKKTHVSGNNHRMGHFNKSPANVEPKNKKVSKRQVVEKERVRQKVVKSKDWKVTAKKDKRANKPVKERNQVVKSNKGHQSKIKVVTKKSKKHTKDKKEKVDKNNNKTLATKNKKVKKKVNEAATEEIVAVAGDRRGRFHEQHSKPLDRSLARKNK